MFTCTLKLSTCPTTLLATVHLTVLLVHKVQEGLRVCVSQTAPSLPPVLVSDTSGRRSSVQKENEDMPQILGILLTYSCIPASTFSGLSVLDTEEEIQNNIMVHGCKCRGS